MAEQDVNVKLGATNEAGSGISAVVNALSAGVAKMTSLLTGLGSKSAETSAAVQRHNEETAMSFRRLQEQVEGANAGMMAGFTKLNAGVAAFLAVLAGGAAFSHYISEANEYTESVTKLGKMFGVDSDQATTFATALHSVGLSNQQATGAFRKFEIQVKRNSDGLKALGVDVDAMRNGTKSSMEGFLDAIRVVGQYKEGQDQLQVAMQILGTRGMADIQKFLRLTKERMQEAEEEQRSLGLTVTQESLAMSRAYTENMAGVHVVLEAVGKVIAEAVMPRLTAMAVWFRSVGPDAVQIMREVMKTFNTVMGAVRDVAVALWDTLVVAFKSVGDVVVAIFGSGGSSLTAMEFFRNVLLVIQAAAIIFKAGLLQVFEVIQATIEVSILWFQRFAATAERAMKMDLTGAVSAWNSYGNKIEEVTRKHAANLVKIALDAKAQIDAALTAGPTPSATAGSPIKPLGGRSAPDFGQKSQKDDRLAEWRDELRQKQEAEGYFHELSKAQEAAFWEAKLALVQGASKEDIRLRREISRIIFEDKKAAAREEMALDDAKFENNIAHYKNDEAMQKMFMNAWVALKLAAYGEDSREYERALKRKEALDQEWVNKHLQIDNIIEGMHRTSQMHMVEMDRLFVNQQVALRNMSKDQALLFERDFEDQMYSIKREALLRQLELEKNGPKDPVKIAAINAQIEALELDHQTKLTEIEYKAEQERKANAIEAANTIQNSFATFLSDISNRTKSLTKAFQDMVKNISDELTRLATKNIAEQLLGAGTPGGDLLNKFTGMIFGTGGGGAASLTAAGTTLSTAGVSLNAAAAALSAAAAAMSIGGGFGGMGSGIMSAFNPMFGSIFGDIPFFQSGTNYVPKDTLAVLHRGEAVIPAVQNKEGVRGGSFQVVNHFHVTGAMDSRTQDQIAATVARSTQRAIYRNL